MLRLTVSTPGNSDDDEDSRSLLNIILSEDEWEIIEACDGMETILLIEQHSPDLLILDDRMPLLSGIEVYQKISQKKINLSVILISAHPELEELASSVGIKYFLPKPVDFSSFLNLVELAYNSLL